MTSTSPLLSHFLRHIYDDCQFPAERMDAWGERINLSKSKIWRVGVGVGVGVEDRGLHSHEDSKHQIKHHLFSVAFSPSPIPVPCWSCHSKCPQHCTGCCFHVALVFLCPISQAHLYQETMSLVTGVIAPSLGTAMGSLATRDATHVF